MSTRQELFSPGNAFIQGRAARQQYEAGQTRNALAQMDLDNAPREIENRNALMDMQRQAQQQALSKEQAQFAYARLRQAADSGNPKAFILQHIPDLASKLGQQGIDLQSLDDQSAAQLVDNLARKYGGEAGIVPETKPELPQIQQTPGPNGSTIVTRGNQMQVVQSPKSGSEPLYYTDDGYVPRSEAVGKKRPVTVNTNQNFQQADKLRDEYNAASKEFITIGDNYLRVRESARDPSAAGDLSLIFAYMKMLDPNSVVREQEFANAQNAAGVPDRIRNAWNKALNGERLNPNQRQDFINQANKVYSSQNQRHETTVKTRYTQMAQRFGIDPQNVVGAFDVPTADGQAPAQPPAAAGPQAAAPSQAQAPAAAIEYLRQNPQFKGAFRQKYGYLPPGM